MTWWTVVSLANACVAAAISLLVFRRAARFHRRLVDDARGERGVEDVPVVKPFWIEGRPPTCPRCPYAGVRGNFCPRCGWQFACNYDVRVWLEGRRELLRLQKEVAEAAAAAAAPALELARETMMWIPADGGPPCFIDVAKERAAERTALSNGMLPPPRPVR